MRDPYGEAECDDPGRRQSRDIVGGLGRVGDELGGAGEQELPGFKPGAPFDECAQDTGVSRAVSQADQLGAGRPLG